MRAYTELLVKTCHKRGAHAIGGMAAFIPSRRDAAVNEAALTRVREDKEREAGDGFDGTWVAHPDLVPVATAEFDNILAERPNQVPRRRDEVDVSAAQLLDVRVPNGSVTDAGLRTNVGVGIQYIESWLRGVGAAAINNLMEDAATAEISRTQVWQWIRHGTRTAEVQPVTRDHVLGVVAEELQKIEASIGTDYYSAGRFQEAAGLFEQVALSDDFVEFLTVPAYERID
jgi:malate synthase